VASTTIYRAGTPATPITRETTIGTLGARDPRLADPLWMARMYEQHGDMWIALETGANRKTVRRRREEMNIHSFGPGRRRGVTLAAAELPADSTSPCLNALELLAERFNRETRPGGPAATEDLLVGRLKAAHDARAAGDERGYDAELIAIACAAMLIHEHRQQYRQAA
jgi:hypothetical protein